MPHDQYKPFNEMHKEWGEYISGPWFGYDPSAVPKATLDGSFSASQLRQVARALDAAEEKGDQDAT
jgi:hypothetical protein